eukprot:201081-Pleurochrysis_carterae.AAC.4
MPKTKDRFKARFDTVTAEKNVKMLLGKLNLVFSLKDQAGAWSKFWNECPNTFKDVPVERLSPLPPLKHALRLASLLIQAARALRHGRRHEV